MCLVSYQFVDGKHIRHVLAHVCVSSEGHEGGQLPQRIAGGGGHQYIDKMETDCQMGYVFCIKFNNRVRFLVIIYKFYSAPNLGLLEIFHLQTLKLCILGQILC